MGYPTRKRPHLATQLKLLEAYGEAAVGRGRRRRAARDSGGAETPGEGADLAVRPVDLGMLAPLRGTRFQPNPPPVEYQRDIRDEGAVPKHFEDVRRLE